MATDVPSQRLSSYVSHMVLRQRLCAADLHLATSDTAPYGAHIVSSCNISCNFANGDSISLRFCWRSHIYYVLPFFPTKHFVRRLWLMLLLWSVSSTRMIPTTNDIKRYVLLLQLIALFCVRALSTVALVLRDRLDRLLLQSV